MNDKQQAKTGSAVYLSHHCFKMFFLIFCKASKMLLDEKIECLCLLLDESESAGLFLH
jgi:hypothetical protein